MNKQITIILKLAIVVVILINSGCRKKKPTEVRYFQQYWVSYYKTEGTYDASAIFSAGNGNGPRIRLDNNASVKLNNTDPWMANGDYTTYHWNGPGTPDVEFTFNEKPGEVYYNSFKIAEMPDIAIAQLDSVVSKSHGFTITVSGGPITDTAKESGSVAVFGPKGSIGRAFTQDTIQFTPERLKWLSAGKITVVVSRSKKTAVTSSDGAGGRMNMTVNVEKDIALTE